MHDDVVCFDTFFLQKLLMEGGPDDMKTWATTKQIRILEKKMLLFPFHSNYHWSLFALVNLNGLDEYRTLDANSKVPVIMHFDSLGEKSPHFRNACPRAVIQWLNRCYQCESTNPYDNAMPFSRYTVKSIEVTVPSQNNDYDCGIFVVHMAASLLSVVKTNEIRMFDVDENCKSIITKSVHFRYGPTTVSVLRHHCKTLLTKLDILRPFQEPVAEGQDEESDDCMVVDEEEKSTSPDKVGSCATTLYAGCVIEYQSDSDKARFTSQVKEVKTHPPTVLLDNGTALSSEATVVIIYFHSAKNKCLFTNYDRQCCKLKDFNLMESVLHPGSYADIENYRQVSVHGTTKTKRFIDRRRRKRAIQMTGQPVVIPEFLVGISDDKFYEKKVKQINYYYVELLSYGEVDFFYKNDLVRSKTESEFNNRIQSLRGKCSAFKRDHRKRLNIPGDTEIEYTPTDRQCPRNTVRMNKLTEVGVKFEHNNLSWTAVVCPVCRETNLVQYNIDVHVKPYYDPAKKTRSKCSKCVAKKHDENHYRNNNLHPLYDKNGVRSDTDDPPSIDDSMFTLPEVLSKLTMAEKMLIRKVSVYVPLYHVQKGIFKLKGHAIAFHQDIPSITSVLPRKLTEIVTVIRQHTNAGDNAVKISQLRVRKKEVLDALKFLKAHHNEYGDIHVMEANASDANLNEDKHARKMQTSSNPDDDEEFVSPAHAMTTEIDEPTMIAGGLLENERDAPNIAVGEVAKPIQDLYDIARQTDQHQETMHFPPINSDDPIR